MSNQDERIGQILVREGHISAADLKDAIQMQLEMKQKNSHVFKLGELLLFQKKINLQQLQGALYQQKHKAQQSRKFTEEAKQRHQERLAAKEARRKQRAKAQGFEESTTFIGRISSMFGKKDKSK